MCQAGYIEETDLHGRVDLGSSVDDRVGGGASLGRSHDIVGDLVGGILAVVWRIECQI